MIDIIVTITGALLTTLIGYFLGIRKMRKEYRGNIGQEIWKVRKASYTDLFRHMVVFPRWPSREGMATYQDLFTLSIHFKDWYFAEGGLFLTTPSKEKYFMVQKKIESLKNEEKDHVIKKENYREIRKVLSALRTEMTNDLLSRERDLLTSKNEEWRGLKEDKET